MIMVINVMMITWCSFPCRRLMWRSCNTGVKKCSASKSSTSCPKLQLCKQGGSGACAAIHWTASISYNNTHSATISYNNMHCASVSYNNTHFVSISYNNTHSVAVWAMLQAFLCLTPLLPFRQQYTVQHTPVFSFTSQFSSFVYFYYFYIIFSGQEITDWHSSVNFLQ